MGTDFQRTILWVFFGMSLVLLWDRWLVYSGRPSMFGTATAPTAPSTAPATAPKESAAARRALRRSFRKHSGCRPPAAVPPLAPSPSKSPPVVVETDLMRVTIDPEGAVLSRVELVKERVAPDWTASGLHGAGDRQVV